MARHIGIVAVSAEGASLCYRTICIEGPALLGPHAHPEVTLHTFPLARYMAPIEAGRWDDVGEILLESARKLRDAGAELAICPDNTAHQGIDLIRARSPLPWLHIAEEVAAAAAERGHRRVLVLGTRWLMEGPVYPPKLAARGIECLTPPAEVRERLNTLIMDELVYGRFEPPARAYFAEAIAAGQRAGADAVALSCTEIPLLIGPADSVLPTLDSTRLLARAALRAAAAAPTTARS